MKVLIAGATGLIGKELVKQCHNSGIDVHYLTTSKHKIVTDFNYKGFYWNPAANEIDSAALDEVSAIVNLAGASVSKKWTTTYKQEILQSRVEGAAVLYEALSNLDHAVQHYISASGISIYPSSEADLYTEDHDAPDDSFLGEVTVAWEVAADRLKELGIKVAKIRTGIVLDGQNGALPKITQPIKYGAGAPLGSGNQWQSWIHIQDIAGIYMHVLLHGFEGVFNGVAPQAVSNKEMTKLIAKHLKKPLWLPKVPPFVLNLMLGEMAQLVLDGQNVSAAKITESGYHFNYPQLSAALEDLL